MLDFEKQELSFQASLYDSRILTFSLSGDSAFLLGWGEDPRFALSLGGFHPKFTPPPPPTVFGEMHRLSVAISAGSNLQLSCQSYLALTPNSLQFGARVDLYASAVGLEVTGYLGFDALIIFSPFSFEVEICGGVAISYEGFELFGVDLNLLLSGPTPWHARGKARIKILFFSIKVGFNFEWGSDEKATLPPVDPWVAIPDGKSLPETLRDPRSWSGVLPAKQAMVEALRSLESEKTEKDQPEPIIVHPAGRLEVRENVVPLGVRLHKVGNAPITGHDFFDITAPLTVDGDSLDVQPAEEFFARGQFEELTADQKLSLPSFEKMKGGVTTAASKAVRVDGTQEAKPLEYESVIIRPDRTSEKPTIPVEILFQGIIPEQQGCVNELDRGVLPAIVRILLVPMVDFGSDLKVVVIKPGSRWKLYDVDLGRAYLLAVENGELIISAIFQVKDRVKDWFDWNQAQVIAHSDAARRAGQSAGPHKRFSTLLPQPKVKTQEERFCIVNASDLTRAKLEKNYSLTHVAAEQLLKKQAAEQASEFLVVPEYEVAV